MMKALVQSGIDSDWMVDIVQSGDRTLIVDSDTNLVIGEILHDGLRVMNQDPYPYEEEV